MIKLPVDNVDEIQYSQWIMKMFDRTEVIERALTLALDPMPGSPLAVDDARTPHYPVSAYAAGQLTVAAGCIASLKQMMVHEAEDRIEMIASPFGAYALVRNALDAAAVALWLLEPRNGTLRVKRRIVLGLDEIEKSAALRRTMDQPSKKVKQRKRLQEVAGLADLGQWNPASEKLPTMTRMLTELERWHADAVLPWLAAWQLASGHAHGKQWASLASHELEEVAGTRTETAANFQMTISYGILAAVLFEAVRLLETAGARFLGLSGRPGPAGGI